MPVLSHSYAHFQAPAGPGYITGTGGANTSAQAGYFADGNGQPRLWVATETWGIIVNAGAWTGGGSPVNWQTEMAGYLSARAAQGVTVVMTDPVWSEASKNTTSSSGNTWDGVTPLAGGSTDPSTAALNETFWTRVDYLVATAASYGITIALVLWNHNDDGHPSWTNTQWQAWGTKVADRYLAAGNLIWMLGNDAWPTGQDTTWNSILTGLAAAGDTRPVIAWWMAEYTSRYDTAANTAAAWGVSHSAADFCYTYNASYWIIEYCYAEVTARGQAALLTPLLGDGYFSQAGTSYSSTLDRALRQEWWWALASGARGMMFESEATFTWTASTDVTRVTSEWFPSVNMPAIIAWFTSLDGWHLLLPDLTDALVTAGRGTRVSGFSSGGSGGHYEPAFTNSYVAASMTPDGTLAVCYLPNATTVTVDTSLLAAGWAAAWADPVTCAETPAGGGPTFNSTAKGNNSQGGPDWVLVFRS